MGKNLTQQKRGKGSATYRAPSFRYLGEAKHCRNLEQQRTGQIVDITHCPGHSAPLAYIEYDNNEHVFMIAPEGVRIGDLVYAGENIEVKPGNTTELRNIPEGTLIFNIESQPGDGGKFVRASGTFAKILTKTKNKVIIELPSKKEREFDVGCRASIGIVAGGGRTDKPFLKAGKRYHKMRGRNKLYPSVSGTSMNAVDHPFGGSSSAHKGRPTQSSRNDPPGRKVGKIAPKRTGRTKR